MSTIKPLIYDATNNRLAEMEMAMPFGKNLLINAECLINQRGFSGGALGEGVYGYDRFKAGAGGCNFSVSGGVWTHASGPIVQIVETPTGVYGSNVTFSVEDPTEDISVTVGGVGGTITAGSGRRGVTLAIPAGSGNLTVQWSATGATYSRPQFERGTTASSFEYRPAGIEITLCQRYFWKTFDASISPSNGTGSFVGALGYVASFSGVGYVGFFISYPVVMRAIPSVVFYSPALSYGGWYNRATSSASGTASSAYNEVGPASMVINNSQLPSDSISQTIYVHMTCDAEL